MFLESSERGANRPAGRGEPDAAAVAAAAGRGRGWSLPGLRREPGRTCGLQGAVLRAQRRLPGTPDWEAQVWVQFFCNCGGILWTPNVLLKRIWISTKWIHQPCDRTDHHLSSIEFVCALASPIHSYLGTPVLSGKYSKLCGKLVLVLN